jgi:hypothetical protein
MKTHLSTAGIILSIAGVVVVYLFSPLNESVIDGGDASTDFRTIDAEVRRKNRLMKVGVALVLGGSLLQLVANYCPDTN